MTEEQKRDERDLAQIVDARMTHIESRVDQLSDTVQSMRSDVASGIGAMREEITQLRAIIARVIGDRDGSGGAAT